MVQRPVFVGVVVIRTDGFNEAAPVMVQRPRQHGVAVGEFERFNEAAPVMVQRPTNTAFQIEQPIRLQ